MIRNLLLSSLLLIGFSATGAVKSSTAFRSFEHHASANLSFTQGGMAFGGEYEMGFHREYGIGVMGRIYSKDKSKGANGFTIINGFVRPHFFLGSWDIHFTGGFGLQSVSAANGSSESVLGPSFGVGVMYAFTEALSIGMDKTDFYGWFTTDYKGGTLSDLALKARYSF